ncbi:MAG: ppnK [Ilumatobacteraceae bacterium]|nr:ppnK [Ilumatobacteraceae bacterium]
MTESATAAPKRVLLVAHHQRDDAAGLALAAAEWLQQHGHVAFMAAEDADALGLMQLYNEMPPTSADLVVSLGGDGTMLRSVQMLEGAPVPIIGVNVGLLGYLSEVEPPGMTAALSRFMAGPEPEHGDWQLEQRMMVDIAIIRNDLASMNRSTSGPETWRALNEGVLEKHEAGHTIRLAVSIDGAPFTSYAADGLIVATPTGSTAYSFSARGPVVSPRHRALLLTPVSPHMLFDRSLVLHPDELVDIEVIGHRPVAMSVDGQRVASLNEGDVVQFGASTATAQFVRFGRRRFHQILKSKFGLSDR